MYTAFSEVSYMNIWHYYTIFTLSGTKALTQGFTLAKQTLYYLSHPPVCFSMVILKMQSCKLFPWAGFKCVPPALGLSSSWDYRYEPTAPCPYLTLLAIQTCSFFSWTRKCTTLKVKIQAAQGGVWPWPQLLAGVDMKIMVWSWAQAKIVKTLSKKITKV
jgi:hypothetical protein